MTLDGGPMDLPVFLVIAASAPLSTLFVIR